MAQGVCFTGNLTAEALSANERAKKRIAFKLTGRPISSVCRLVSLTKKAHTACDKQNFVLDVHVTPGNVHDSAAFDPLYDELCKYYPEHKTVVADSAYKTPWICKRIFDSGRILSTSYTRPKTKANGHPWWNYVYDEYFDDVICLLFCSHSKNLLWCHRHSRFLYRLSRALF